MAPRGLDFDHVTYHLETEGKLGVLVVTGRIVNRSTHELIVPQLELTLLDADRHKLTHWTYVAPVLTLKAGETANIHARFSDPPHDARNLEVRFVRAGE